MSKQLLSTSARLVFRRPFSLSRTTRTFSAVPHDSDNYVSPLKEFFERVEKNDDFGAPDLPDEVPKYLKCGVREDALRFRTMHYGRLQLPPHVQPWEHRVTVRVSLDEIPLENDLERKLVSEIVGSRIKGDILQLSSNQFGSRIENKRHLVSMLDRIVLGAKRLAKEIGQQPQGSVQESS